MHMVSGDPGPSFILPSENLKIWSYCTNSATYIMNHNSYCEAL